MGNPLLIAKDGGNHFVPGGNKETGHPIPPRRNHGGTAAAPGDVLGHEGKEHGDFILFIICMKDFPGAGKQQGLLLFQRVVHGSRPPFYVERN